MNNENDEDMEQARKWLLVDQKELANFAAEHDKRYRQRKAAEAYGYATEPVAFTAVNCTSCNVALTSLNHKQDRVCRYCVERAVGLKWANAHRAIRHERKLKAAVGGAWVVLFYVVLAMAAAAGLGWVGATVAWHIGRLF